MRPRAGLLLGLFLAGCSLATDFDREYPDTDGGPGQVPDPDDPPDPKNCATLCAGHAQCFVQDARCPQLWVVTGATTAEFAESCMEPCTAMGGVGAAFADALRDGVGCRDWVTSQIKLAPELEPVCDRGVKLCEGLCTADGDDFNDCAQASGQCERNCRERDTAFWQCVAQDLPRDMTPVRFDDAYCNAISACYPRE